MLWVGFENEKLFVLFVCFVPKFVLYGYTHPHLFLISVWRDHLVEGKDYHLGFNCLEFFENFVCSGVKFLLKSGQKFDVL